jgi:hypothetical protein
VIAGNKYQKPHPEKDGAFLRAQHERARKDPCLRMMDASLNPSRPAGLTL